MDHCTDVFFFEDVVKRVTVPYIRVVKRGLFAGYGLNASEDLLIGIAEIIKYNDFFSGSEQFNHSVTSDESGTAGNKYLSHKTSFNGFHMTI